MIRSGLGLGFLGLSSLVTGCDRGQATSATAHVTQDLASSRRGAERVGAGLPFRFSGIPQQSDRLICTTVPGASISVDGASTQADSDGRFVLGFDRDAPPTALIEIVSGTHSARLSLDIAARTYPASQIEGLPEETVNPPQGILARLEAETALKRAAFGSRNPIARGFEESFRWPLDIVRITSPWGATRRLNAAGERPHYGVDLGAPIGTPIHAPASGFVVLAQPDMLVEGGMVAIDHGQGLITTYLHQERLAVTVGQRVTPGMVIGYVGARGRATGPHLCWRMRWRGRNLDPTRAVGSS